MNILNAILGFFKNLDWKFVIAGFGVVIIFVVIVYLLVIIVNSVQHRTGLMNVKLPDINKYNNKGSDVAQFKEIEDMAIELVNPNEDTLESQADIAVQDDVEFLTALSVETKTFIPAEDYDETNMPSVGEIDYDAILEEKRQAAKAMEKERMDKLKEIALADAKDEAMDFVNNIENGESIT